METAGRGKASRRKEAAGAQKRTGKASQDTGRGAEASEAFFPRQG